MKYRNTNSSDINTKNTDINTNSSDINNSIIENGKGNEGAWQQTSNKSRNRKKNKNKK